MGKRKSDGVIAASAVRPSRTAHDSVVQGIGRAIVSGRFAPGDLLPGKDELSERFGVSHTSVREALQTLSAKGLIAAKTKVGTWVLPGQHWNMFDSDVLAWRLAKGADRQFVARLFEVRQAFEPVAAALAARRRSEADLHELRLHLATMASSSGNKQRFTEADVAFHLRVLDASGNPLMRSIGALIAAALGAAFELSAPTDNLVLERHAHRQHSDIVDALAKKDAQHASEAMMRVIRQGWKTYAHVDDRPLANLGLRRFLETNE